MSEKSKPSGWAEEAAQWAVENRLFLGDETGDCRWQDTVTREQLAVILLRYHKQFHS
ncbi:hypothetical protein [Papillibacter cinnamivorans]|uniref:hypothetical protein n=1 Tax=Papillibacter cinnamivorans TaxID=100176 RepID=UPI0013565A83|nr:hypothetical protein [Papillibacter cinnamivorans]